MASVRDVPPGKSGSSVISDGGGTTPRRRQAARAPERLADNRLAGTWSLRFGHFGCSDEETCGGIVQAFEDRFIGGDLSVAYRGRWRLEGPRLAASIEICRHGADGRLLEVLGITANEYAFECVAEPVAPGRFEGRIPRPGHPDVRIIMRRLQIERHDEARPGASKPRHFQPAQPRPPAGPYVEEKYPGWVRLLILFAVPIALWAGIIAVITSLL